MSLKAKIEKLKSSQKFNKSNINKYGVGSFLTIKHPKDLSLEIHQYIQLLEKQQKEEINMTEIINSILETIKLILTLEKENIKESIAQYKSLCSFLHSILVQEELISVIFLNVKFHYLNLENILVSNSLGNNKPIDDKCLGYFLREYKSFSNILKKQHSFKIIELRYLEEEVKKSMKIN
ncbi:hypothetical protein H312_02068 [Anncaliia algerae PRA339]|uniref:Uncharacterized protein n=1 Tax=Anncaliia algerae PRA339 TaxID=1288291 RepID=A0A059EZT6_9MICR|nr:hypothetical protein H312_02068 [Anncaliia algerae PRA339]